MSEHGILLTCTRNHQQKLAMGEGITKQWAIEYGALLDGTSAAYRYPPRDYPGGQIGRCGSLRPRFAWIPDGPTVPCGEWITATLYGAWPEDPMPERPVKMERGTAPD